MTEPASGRVVVLSPHLDDAVLSAWSVLSGAADVEVVNVFAGLPEPGPAPRWDQLTGAEERRAQMEARLDEDPAALAVAGRNARYLPFLDWHYRDGEPPRDEIEGALGDLVGGAGEVHAPAGIGGHADHVLVRDLAIGLARRLDLALVLYAELPYAVRFGWPGWVTGRRAEHMDVAERDWELSWQGAPLAQSELEPWSRALDGEEQAAKLAAMRRYRTQFAVLNQGTVGLLEHPSVLPWEAGWRLP